MTYCEKIVKNKDMLAWFLVSFGRVATMLTTLTCWDGEKGREIFDAIDNHYFEVMSREGGMVKEFARWLLKQDAERGWQNDEAMLGMMERFLNESWEVDYETEGIR